MSCILKFRSLKISLETLERSFHREEKRQICREASWDIWNSPLCSQASHHETVAKMFMTVLWPLVFISLFTILTPVLICPFSHFTDEVVLRTHPIKMRGSIAFLCCLAVASGFVLKFDDEVQWRAWKSFHGKAYSTESEEAARKAIWKDNLGVRNGSFCEIPL